MNRRKARSRHRAMKDPQVRSNKKYGIFIYMRCRSIPGVRLYWMWWQLRCENHNIVALCQRLFVPINVCSCDYENKGRTYDVIDR